MKKRRTFSARRRALARKIAGCRLMQPPELKVLRFFIIPPPPVQ